ncbi:nuclear transport factor 2 family protein [Streptomyces sp. NPDC091272]|uniref:nuclear transport factor 2 family protein n=1 Tax=Streptomyces sp. NPDC091272 TaxID=3365981 RepID=UPI00382A6BE9
MTPTLQAERTLTVAAVEQLVTDWYAALDRHDPLDEVLPMLVSDGLTMHLPETTLHGLDGFRSWYEAVTHRFFDETHTLTSLDIRLGDGPSAEVKVVVNWQTTVWKAPAPTSEWLGFDAYQTWTVSLEDGAARIRTYSVDALAPMAGSGSL